MKPISALITELIEKINNLSSYWHISLENNTISFAEPWLTIIKTASAAKDQIAELMAEELIEVGFKTTIAKLVANMILAVTEIFEIIELSLIRVPSSKATAISPAPKLKIS